MFMFFNSVLKRVSKYQKRKQFLKMKTDILVR
jgi:hypothetical protein